VKSLLLRLGRRRPSFRKLKNEGALFGMVAMAMFSAVRNYHNKPMIL
jgi:hypothetical protein